MLERTLTSVPARSPSEVPTTICAHGTTTSPIGVRRGRSSSRTTPSPPRGSGVREEELPLTSEGDKGKEGLRGEHGARNMLLHPPTLFHINFATSLLHAKENNIIIIAHNGYLNNIPTDRYKINERLELRNLIFTTLSLITVHVNSNNNNNNSNGTSTVFYYVITSRPLNADVPLSSTFFFPAATTLMLRRVTFLAPQCSK